MPSVAMIPPRLRQWNIRGGAPVPRAEKRFRKKILNDTETLSPVLPDETEEATRRLLAKACERELMFATAESCTGGMLASLLTDVKGVAHAFDRGFVTYTEEAKSEMLGVPPS
jgi:hypothetical protein